MGGAVYPQCQQAAYAAAQKYGLPPMLVYQLLLAENSCKSTGASHTGNQGIAQLGSSFIQTYCPGTNPNDPVAAIDCAAKGLSTLFRQFGSYGLALAAYHGGPRDVKKAAPCIPDKNDGLSTSLNYVKKILSRAGLPFDFQEDCSKAASTQPGNGGVVGPPRGTTGGGTTTAPITPVEIGSNFRMYLILGLALVLIVAVIGRYRG